MRNIRIIEPEKPPKSFSECLEERAKTLIEKLENRGLGGWGGDPVSTVERNVHLTLDQIERWRGLHAQLRRQLLRLECYVDTDYMAANLRLARTHYLFLEREKLKKKLWMIEEERRSLAVQEERGMRDLHDRLLTQLNQVRLLRPGSG